MLLATRRALFKEIALAPLGFDYDVFTPGMAKRASSVFAAAPIVQGEWTQAGSLLPDELMLPRGASFGNPTGVAYSNIDPYQGTIVLWVTPEWAGNDGLTHWLFRSSPSAVSIYKSAGNNLVLACSGVYASISTATWVAGTRYFVVGRWDLKNTLDGTNHLCISVNDAHTFTTGTISVVDPGLTLFVGNSASGTADALIEGLTIYRRPLFDETYGTPGAFDASGPIDEIAAIHALGSGADPCLITGSWDVVFCLPTDSSPGALVTGVGEAWSHPHGSNLLNHWTLEDASYGGGQYAIAFNGTSTSIDCGSAAVLDDIPAGGNELTVDAWVRLDTATASDTRWIVCKNIFNTRGWSLRYYNNNVYFKCELATATNMQAFQTFVPDGKWHHVVGYYNDTTKTGQVAVDGRWGSTNTGVGAYQTDAADTLYIGRREYLDQVWLGAIGWLRLSNNDRHTAGTDFIPPREFPGADGNTVEAWNLADGTGVTAVAQVTSPGNDGTIANGTWEQQWDDVLTPVYPTSLEFDVAATYVDCGSAAALDDLGNAKAFTAEGWFRHDGGSVEIIIGKGYTGQGGWAVYTAGTNTLFLRVDLATTDVTAISSTVTFGDGKWHHYRVYYDDATKTGRAAVDGIWGNASVGAGAWQTDAVRSLIIGRRADTAVWYWEGALSWQRVSDNDRGGGATGATFIPPDRVNPPGADGNTVEQWNLQDGAGLTALAVVTTPGNDGAITMGSGRWWNTPDAPSEGPGSRIYQWGYDIGSDAANDGIHQHQAGLDAGENYVARIPVRYEADKRAWPSIVAYDETNGAAISTFNGPRLVDVHTSSGAGSDANLRNPNTLFPVSLVGGTVYNITDGSSATITGVAGTNQNELVGSLSGGTDNDWDTSDVYMIVPPAGWSWTEPFCFELPTISRNGAAADCVHISFRLLNAAGEGVIYWQQVELLENLFDNPSLETPAAGANPWIPDGWTNANLDSGDADKETAVIHSGAGSMEWNPGAQNENVNQTGLSSQYKFVGVGLWQYGDGTAALRLCTSSLGTGHAQYDPTSRTLGSGNAQSWISYMGVYRAVGPSGVTLQVLAIDVVPSADRFADDTWAVELDDVSLTVTPASEPKSIETSGLRIDGRDICSLSISAGVLRPNVGRVEFNWTPRHGAGDFLKFSESGSAYIVCVYGDAINFIILRHHDTDNIRLVCDAGGAGVNVGNWYSTGIVAGQTYHMEIKYSPTKLQFIMDGVVRITIDTSVMFGTALATAYWGTNQASLLQADATFAKA